MPDPGATTTAAVTVSWLIVVFSGTVRLPQIFSIVRHKSVEGLSLTGFAIQGVCGAVAMVYCISRAYPIESYAENIILIAGKVALILLFSIMADDPRERAAAWRWNAAILAYLVARFVAWDAPGAYVADEVLMSASIPVNALATIPQIYLNYREGKTGKLSWYMPLSIAVGCSLRIFTAYVLMDGDAVLVASFAVSVVLNVVSLVQIYIYRPANVPLLDYLFNDFRYHLLSSAASFAPAPTAVVMESMRAAGDAPPSAGRAAPSADGTPAPADAEPA